MAWFFQPGSNRVIGAVFQGLYPARPRALAAPNLARGAKSPLQAFPNQEFRAFAIGAHPQRPDMPNAFQLNLNLLWEPPFWS